MKCGREGERAVAGWKHRLLQKEGGEEQVVIDKNVKEIVNKYEQLFTGIGRAKVEPVHIDVDPAVKPIQQKRRPMAIHYVDKFKAHIEELQAAGVVSGPLGSDHAKGWISNPVITGKKWDSNKIRVNLDTTHMN